MSNFLVEILPWISTTYCQCNLPTYLLLKKPLHFWIKSYFSPIFSNFLNIFFFGYYMSLYWLVFCSSHFSYFVLVTFGDKVKKIWRYYVIFVYILQGKMGKMEKKGKKITHLKWPKYQKTKDENMGWTKHKSFFFRL